MVDKDQILRLIKTHFVVVSNTSLENSIEILDDGGVDVQGHVVMTRPAGGKIPVRFNMIDGIFRAEGVGLKNLENVPYVCSSLYVANNEITSLEGCPDYLNTLEVSNNQLKDLKHLPEILETLIAFENPLSSLDGLSAPPEREFLNVQLSWSKDLPLLRTLVASTIHIGRPGGGYSRLAKMEPVNSILLKYAGTGKKGMLGAAAELTKAGYKENARW
jgi:hypothetical protein